MDQSIEKDNYIKILKKSIETAITKSEQYIMKKDFKQASYIFIKQIGITFSDYGFHDLREKIDQSETIGFKTREALEKIKEVEEMRKVVEDIFIEAFFDFSNEDDNSQT